jgi:hypothetical protein
MIRHIEERPECFNDLDGHYSFMHQRDPKSGEIIGYIAYRFNGDTAEVVMFFIGGALQDRQGITEEWMYEDAQWMKDMLSWHGPHNLPVRKITVVTTWPCKIWNDIATSVFGSRPMRMYVCSQEV